MTAPVAARPLISRRCGALAGRVRVPGDRSISHRALMLGALSLGETRIGGLLESDDVLRTSDALRALGAEIGRLEDGSWRTVGRGVGGLAEPARVLDIGNSGTAAGLLMGLLATHPFTSFMTGDASLAGRPMARVAVPLERMGAGFVLRSRGRLPAAILGTAMPVPIEYRLPVASAQVKSAILLAGLSTPGRTTVIEAEPTRDHTERMLRHFGVEVETVEREDGALAVSLAGPAELTARDLVVPGDPGSAAFPAVAALIRPGSALTLPGIGVNPRRTGLFETLAEMGGDLTFTDRREEGGEPVADLLVKASTLRGVEVPPGRVPGMIDEYPALCVAAACATGPTVMRGIGELRVKGSDRPALMADGLTACGVRVEVGEDWMVVHGTGRPPRGGATASAAMDPRIAMGFLVLGLAAEEPVGVDDGGTIDTSFPGFVDLMNGLGAAIGAPCP